MAMRPESATATPWSPTPTRRRCCKAHVLPLEAIRLTCNSLFGGWGTRWWLTNSLWQVPPEKRQCGADATELYQEPYPTHGCACRPLRLGHFTNF